MGSVEEGGLGARRTLLLVEASSSFPSALRISLLAIALLAALVSILRLLARRLIRVLAGLSGPIALSILLTILVGIILFVITSPKGRQHMTTEAVQFKCGGILLANNRDLCLHMRLCRCRTRNAIQCLCDFLSAGFLLC